MNKVKTENAELRENVSRWSESSELVRVETTESRLFENSSETVLQRIPRNFVSASPEIVAFDAFRNKPFHNAQVSPVMELFSNEGPYRLNCQNKICFLSSMNSLLYPRSSLVGGVYEASYCRTIWLFVLFELIGTPKHGALY